jgi:lipid II:glycine glycyltransferase (peptidoglycan interpeptide bridge formation enzyme)
MRIESISIQDWRVWTEDKDYCPFQTPAWAYAHEESYPERKVVTKLFTFSDGTEALFPLVEMKSKLGFKSYESMPEGGYGGFLWNKKLSLQKLNEIINSVKKINILHFGIFPSPCRDYRFLEQKGFVAKDAFTHILSLGNVHFTGKCRNQVKKAVKSGVTTERVNDISGPRNYYDLYLNSAARWGLPDNLIKPLKFFERLFELGQGKVKYYLAKYEGKYIAGVVVLCGKESCFYWSGAMLKEFGTICPNNLLIDRVVEDARNNNYKYLNMGSSAGLPGVQKFKESFGARRVDYKYYIYENPILKIYRRFP